MCVPSLEPNQPKPSESPIFTTSSTGSMFCQCPSPNHVKSQQSQSHQTASKTQKNQRWGGVAPFHVAGRSTGCSLAVSAPHGSRLVPGHSFRTLSGRDSCDVSQLPTLQDVFLCNVLTKEFLPLSLVPLIREEYGKLLSRVVQTNRSDAWDTQSDCVEYNRFIFRSNRCVFQKAQCITKSSVCGFELHGTKMWP